MIAEEGYGSASHSYILVRGSSLLRLLAHRFGVARPRRLRGETTSSLPDSSELEAAAAREIQVRAAGGERDTLAVRLAYLLGTLGKQPPR